MNEQEEILLELQKQLAIEAPAVVSEADLLNKIEQRISELLLQQAEVFFQLMYKLDISEKKLNEALDDKEHGVGKLAAIIYKRQVEKIKLRALFSNPSEPIDPELQW